MFTYVFSLQTFFVAVREAASVVTLTLISVVCCELWLKHVQLARHSELSSKVRVKALSFVSSVTRQKKKVIYIHSYVVYTVPYDVWHQCIY